MANVDGDVAKLIIKVGGAKLTDDMMDSLVSLKVNSALGATSISKIDFFDKSAELQTDAKFEVGKSVEISIGSQSAPSVIFNGDVIRIDYIFVTGEIDKIRLICYDGLHRLSKIWHSRAFINKKISDIATTMASEASLTGNKIDATTATFEHLYQNNQSNLDFLRMHAKRIGYEVDIEGKGLVFKKARYQSATSSAVILKWGDNLIDFNAKIDASDVLAEVVVSSWDPDTKTNVESSVKAGSEYKVGTVTTRGTSMVKTKLKSEAKVYRLDIPSATSAEATAIAKTHLTMASMNYLKAEGICKGEPKFALGKTLEIKGVGTKISGTYYISSFEHIYNKKGFKTSFEIQSNGTFT